MTPMLLEMSETLKHLIHPFGEQWYLRWALFALLIAAFVAMPLLFRKRISRTKDGVSTYQARQTLAWLPLGLVLLAAAAALVVIPYLPFEYNAEASSPVRELEWKTFNPFNPDSNAARIILIFVVLPLVVGLPLLQYFFIRRQLAMPSRLMLAGLRMIVLWMIFILLCAPYTSITPEHQEHWRSAIVIDASSSMNHRADPLSPFVTLEYGTSFNEDRDLQEALEVDRKETQALLDYLDGNLGLPLVRTEPTPFPMSTKNMELFDLRRMTRKVIRHRTTRLLRKLDLLRGQRPDIASLQETYEGIAAKKEELRKQNASLLQLRATQDREAIASKESTIADLESDLTLLNLSIEKALYAGPLFEVIKNQRAQVAEESADAKRLDELKPRLERAITQLATNLTSTLHTKGPTRWDIACELLMPGMGPSRDSEATGTPLEIGSEKLALIDALRRHDAAQGDRLPADIADLLLEAAKSPQDSLRAILSQQKSDKALPEDLALVSASAHGKDLISFYTFSAPDFGSGSTRSYRQIAFEEIDFLRADGDMTKMHNAYSDIVTKESAGELANVIFLSDGVDTSTDVLEHAKNAQALRWSLDNSGKGPRIHTLLVGYSSQGKLLAAKAIKAPKIARRDELVTVELTIEANQEWRDVEVILEKKKDFGNNEELSYSLLNNEAGTTSVNVTPTRQDDGTFLNFVEIAFTPEVSDDDPHMKRDERGYKTWFFPLQIRLNREAMPGEMTYDNNVIELTEPLRVTDRQIRVLLIDQRFRYETRYLVEALARDKAFEMQSFIFDADREWPQRSSNHSNEVRRRVPPLVHPFSKTLFRDSSKAKTAPAATYDDWLENHYDCVIVGDVHSSIFSKVRDDDNGYWLEDYVRSRSGGLIFLAGQYNMPWSYGNGPLSELVPVKVPESRATAKIDVTRQHFFGITPIGQSSDILTFSVSSKRQQELWGYADKDGNYTRGQLDGFFWYAKTEGPKDPSSIVLARAVQHDSKLIFSASQGTPNDALIVGRKEGKGRVLYVGTDELWRMRRYFGDFYTYRFWQNAIRWAAAPHLTEEPDAATDLKIFTDLPRYNLGDEVTAFCEVLGGEQNLDKIHSAQSQARQAMGMTDDGSSIPILLNWTVTTNDGEKRKDVMVVNDPLRNLRFQNVFKPIVPGRYELSLVNDPLENRDPYSFIVEASTEAKRELDRMPEVDGDSLALLASIRKGTVSDSEEDGDAAEARWYAHFADVDQLLMHEGDTVVTEGSEVHAAWNLLQLLIVIASLLAIEWFVRKLVRLA